jgi:hypothetical protein
MPWNADATTVSKNGVSLTQQKNSSECADADILRIWVQIMVKR